MSRRTRAFSLIEVMVALAIAAVLSTVILGVLLNAVETARRTRLRSELASSGNLLAQMLRQELRQAGLGVPTGVEVVSGANPLYGSVLVATATEVGVLGDFPRPDASYNTLGFLDDRPASGGSTHHISWHTENNGSCMPTGAVGSCTTDVTSVFFPGEASQLCASVGAAQAPDRTCPWGLKRLRGAEPFQVVAGNRQWFGATNSATLTVHAHGGPSPLQIHTGNDFPAAWPNAVAGQLPAGGQGQGWVTTLDRVFFRFDNVNKRVERIQCWGTPNVNHALWPAPTATTAGANPCANPFEGMAAYETVARNVESLVFTYFNVAGVAVTNIDTAAEKVSVRRVDYRIVLQKSTNGQTVRHEVTGGVALTMAAP